MTTKTMHSAAAAVAVALCALLLSLPSTAAGGSSTNATDTATPGTPVTLEAPTYTPTLLPKACRNRAWSQCGGRQHTGSTCCPPGSGCSKESQWYSQCVPGHSPPAATPTVLYTAAAVDTAKYAAAPAAKAEACGNREWGQCGGRQHTGATCCPLGSGCAVTNEWYSQCKPGYEAPEEKEEKEGQCQPLWYQCGGKQWNGATTCCEGEECVKQSEWYSQCKPAKLKGTVERLCIFDFDDTIKIGAGRRIRVGRDVDAILKKCKEMGYGIAIATASCETEFQKTYLRDAVNADIFSDAMLSSAAYQACQEVKTPALRKVLDHFDMGDVPECAVFFDDKDVNGKFSREAEVPFVKVDPNYGVTWNDFWQGMSLLEKNCPMSGDNAM